MNIKQWRKYVNNKEAVCVGKIDIACGYIYLYSQEINLCYPYVIMNVERMYVVAIFKDKLEAMLCTAALNHIVEVARNEREAKTEISLP